MMRPAHLAILSLYLLLLQSTFAWAGRNPFVPSPPAAPPASMAEAPLRDNKGQGLPNVKGGVYRPSGGLLPLPPPPAGYPTLRLPPVSEDLTSIPGPKSEKGTAAKDERKSDVFLSRDELQAARAKCSVALRSPSLMTFTPEGGRQIIRLGIVGGRQCVKGVMSSRAWLDVSAVTDSGELTIVVESNEEEESRSGEINIANTGTSLTISIEQAGSTSKFRKLKL